MVLHDFYVIPGTAAAIGSKVLQPKLDVYYISVNYYCLRSSQDLHLFWNSVLLIKISILLYSKKVSWMSTAFCSSVEVENL